MQIQVRERMRDGAFIAVVDGVEVVVPDDMSNRHRQFIKAEIEDAGGALPPVPEPPPKLLPDLEPWQFRAMLKLSGKEPDLVAFLDALPEPQQTVAKAKLDYTLTFKRDNDLVLSAREALGLSDAELDALWTQASSL